MLTADLVRVRLKMGELAPAFVKADDEKLLERAEELVGLFREGVGRTRGELDEEVAGLIGDGVDHKLTRGLVKVMLDKAEFAVSSPVEPATLRAAVFREAARLGPLAERPMEGRATRDDVFRAVATALGIDAAAIPGALYADHDDRQVLERVDVPSASWLLHRYNVALVQAVLIRAEEVRVRLAPPQPARLRQLFRAVKFHQLIHTARRQDDGGYELVLDGPASLFSQTTRYGLSLAKFFPSLLLQPGAWSLEASVAWTRGKSTLKLSSEEGLRSHYADQGAYETREAAWFAERFEALQSGWALSRDGEPLSQGGEAVVIPDFTFRKDGRVAHLEILGFWRKGTVVRRVQLMRRHGPPNLVLAVSRRLAGEAVEELPDLVVPFAEVIPAKEVLKRVEAAAR